MEYSISKSKYCKAVQCPKILWLDKNKPEPAEDTGSEAVLENGTEVGDLARQYFGDYALVEFSLDKAAMCAETDRYLKEGKTTIAEASFLYDNCFCSVDLLRVEGDHVDIIEVKSSTDIHDNMHDLMIPFQKQYYYQKEFQGSYSIKYVLPALCPGDPKMNYKALEGVHNGSEAMQHMQRCRNILLRK